MKARWTELISKWYAFVLVAGLSSFALSWGVSIRCKPTKEERLYYLVLTYGVDAQLLAERSKAVTTGIREVKVHYQNLQQEDDAKRLFTYVYDSCDFYIVPESWMTLASGYSCHFDRETLTNAIPSSINHELYSFQGAYSGIRLFDAKQDKGSAEEYFTYVNEGSGKENFYLCFPASSCQSGSLNHQDLDNALKCAQSLFL